MDNGADFSDVEIILTLPRSIAAVAGERLQQTLRQRYPDATVTITENSFDIEHEVNVISSNHAQYEAVTADLYAAQADDTRWVDTLIREVAEE